MENHLFRVIYEDKEGWEHSIVYCCVDKSQARRLFYSERKPGELISRIVREDT